MRGASSITESGRQYFVWEFLEQVYDFYGMMDIWTHLWNNETLFIWSYMQGE